jgi:Fic family protein
MTEIAIFIYLWVHYYGMVSIKKRVLAGKARYYLHHSYRIDGKIRTREVYLGDRIPGDLERRKEDFIRGIFGEKWFVCFDRILRNYSRERKRTPKSALDEQTREFSVRYTYDTNRIEGSTLTFRETADLLVRGITPGSRPLGDVKEAEAHRDMFLEMLGCKKDISYQLILFWHRRLLERTRPDIAGRIRAHQVRISGSEFVPPSPVEVYPLLMEFMKWYHRAERKIHPVELAALVHLKFVTIHPFSDGNGRISRILMNFVLQRNGYPMLNITYKKRGGYYRALERAQTRREDIIFLNWFFKRYAKEFKMFIQD